MDQFPSVFERFEDEIGIEKFEEYHQLKLDFVHWAGFRWINSMDQNRALRKEADKRGIPFRPFIKRVRPAPKAKPIQKPAKQAKIIKVTRKYVISSNKKGIVQRRDRKTGRFV